MTDTPLNLPEKTARLVLRCETDCVSAFSPLLQSGVYLHSRNIGQSVRVFLTGQLQLNDKYIGDRISTIFLDGMPVDDLDAALLKNGSRLALSSAMPGLVGATMRQRGSLASLRSAITYRADESCEQGEGLICMKLFNLVMREIGKKILRAGVYVRPKAFQELLTGQHMLFQDCVAIFLNGSAAAPEELLSGKLFEESTLLELTVIMP